VVGQAVPPAAVIVSALAKRSDHEEQSPADTRKHSCWRFRARKLALIPVVTVADLASTADVIVLGKIVSTRQVGVTTLELGAEKGASRVMAAEAACPGSSEGTARHVGRHRAVLPARRSNRLPNASVGTGRHLLSQPHGPRIWLHKARTIRLLLGCPRRRPRARAP